MELPLLIVDKPLVCQRGLPGRLSSHCAAVGGPVFRRCALRVLAPPAASRPPTASGRDGNAFLRFAPTLNSAWSFHCARKLACGSPCFIGLTTACFRHWRRPSCAPALRLRGVPCLRTSCARHFSPSGLHLFASVCFAKNARNDVHAVISDESLVLPILCQCSEPRMGVTHAHPRLFPLQFCAAYGAGVAAGTAGSMEGSETTAANRMELVSAS